MPGSGHAPTARLLCRAGAVGGTRFELRDEAVLGRDPQCDVVVASAGVSSRHARIVWNQAERGYVLEDLDSLNGTELDGLPVAGAERLGRLHVITLGGTVELVYQGPELVSATPAAAAPAAAAPAAPGADREGTLMEREPFVLPGALAAPASPEGSVAGLDGESTRADGDPLVLPSVLAALDPELAPEPQSGPQTEPEPEPPPRSWRLRVPGNEPPGGFALQPGQNRIGRLPELEIVIDAADVSRLHAVLTVRGDEVAVRDAGSRNGTWIGDRMVAGEAAVPLGAVLRLGGIEARIEASDDRSDPDPGGDS